MTTRLGLRALIGINLLAEMTNNEILFFADDVALVSSNAQGSLTAQAVTQNNLDTISRFGIDWEIKFNASKTIQQTITDT